MTYVGISPLTSFPFPAWQDDTVDTIYYIYPLGPPSTLHPASRSKNWVIKEGRDPVGPRPGRSPSQAGELLLGARDAQRLRTMRQRLTNTRKRTNLKSHLSNTPTQHRLVRVKNLYVTGRHKLRHTPYTGKE